MKKLFILPLFALLFLAVSCPNNNPPKPAPPEVLPPITQTGAGTFGCLLNGKVWLPSNSGALITLDCQYYRGLFLLSAGRVLKDPDVSQWFSSAIKPVYGGGTYYYKSSPPLGGSPGASFSDDVKNSSYQTDDKDSLNTYVTITKLDSTNRIVSGTFSFLFTKIGYDTVRITNGRFDMKYTY